MQIQETPRTITGVMKTVRDLTEEKTGVRAQIGVMTQGVMTQGVMTQGVMTQGVMTFEVEKVPIVAMMLEMGKYGLMMSDVMKPGAEKALIGVMNS